MNKNPMKPNFLICLAVTFGVAATSADVLPVSNETKIAAIRSGYVLGKEYVSIVSIDSLAEQTKWNPLRESVPLPIDRAVRKALDYANDSWNFKNITDQHGKWDVKTVSLDRLGATNDWVYTVEITQRGPIQGIRPAPMKLVVLLDGTVIRPTTAKAK